MKRIILLVMLLICASSVVYANSGPWRDEPAPGFNAVPIKSNAVEVLHEDLTFDTTGSTVPSMAVVTAKYALKNVTDRPETYSIAFPYVGSFYNSSNEQDAYFSTKVLFDGKKIVPKIKLIPGLLFDVTNGSAGKGVYSEERLENLRFEDILKYMKSAVAAEDFDITKYVDVNPAGELIGPVRKNEMVVLVLFDITLQPNASHELQVAYHQVGGADRYTTKSYTYIYDYFLEPAKYWKDFKDLSITVKAPKGYEITESNLALSETGKGKGVYTGHFDTLPEKNLEFKMYKSLSPAEKAYEAIDMKLNLGWFIPLMVIMGLPLILVIAALGIIAKKKGRDRNS